MSNTNATLDPLLVTDSKTTANVKRAKWHLG